MPAGSLEAVSHLSRSVAAGDGQKGTGGEMGGGRKLRQLWGC